MERNVHIYPILWNDITELFHLIIYGGISETYMY